MHYSIKSQVQKNEEVGDYNNPIIDTIGVQYQNLKGEINISKDILPGSFKRSNN